jgi:hypothetical protein
MAMSFFVCLYIKETNGLSDMFTKPMGKKCFNLIYSHVDGFHYGIYLEAVTRIQNDTFLNTIGFS